MSKSECFANGSHKEPIGSAWVTNKIRLLSVVVPSGEYEQARGLLNAGKPEKAVRAAYRSAAAALVGVIRGHIWDEICYVRSLRVETVLEEELQRLFYEVWGLEQQLSQDPRTACGAAFDYLEVLRLRFDIVAPARVLLERIRWWQANTVDIPYGDLAEDLHTIKIRVEDLIKDPSSAKENTLEVLRGQLLEIHGRADNVRTALTMSAAGENSRRNGGRERTPGRRRGRREARGRRVQDWRALLQPNDGEDEAPAGEALVAAS